MRTTAKVLETLFPGIRHRIIAVMFAEPERWWPLAELSARLAEPPGSLRREMSALCAGVLMRKRMNLRTFFRPDPSCPFFGELQGMAAKCAALERHNGRETILVVEDEPATLKISRILLESWGYCVLEAHSAFEAIELFESHLRDVRLVLSDVVMPGMSGPELCERLKARKPEVRILLMSGYQTEQVARGRHGFLQKPFNPAGLARKIREELDR